MTEQLRLQGLDPPRYIRPVAGRDEPLFWVKRIRVLSELKPGDEFIVRDVEFRRGLNIVWANPVAPSSKNQLFQSGVAGHTAGKTTLCRLIRYALGSRSFAAESTKKRIREKLPTGWIIAEIIISGNLWVVGRPFGIGPHPFSMQGATIEQALDDGNRDDYQEFLSTLSAAATNNLPAACFPATDEPIRWDHLLPWLSRDQECRFADFLEWRHNSSGSDAPALNVDERQFLIRSILGLITDAEREEQQRNAQLVLQKKDATRMEPLLSYQADMDRDRIQRLLGVSVAQFSTGLFRSQAHAELGLRKDALNDDMQNLESSDQRTDLRSDLENAIQTETNARRNLQEVETRLSVEQGALKQLQGDAQVDLLSSLPPAREYCNMPMRLAREHGCPLANSRPFQLDEKRSEKSADEELVEQRSVVQELEKMAEDKRNALSAAEAATSEARRSFLKASISFDEQRGQLLRRQADLQLSERLIDEAENAWRKSIEQSDAIEKLAGDIEASYAKQEQLRREARDALGRFSSTFDYVLRAILGDDLVARVDTSGRSLSLIVEHQGERDSEAIVTVKLLAFDLAAITDSIEGRGYFPRFLIHDGPREADMSPDIYERLFLYARQLEECFEDDPGFQYIVTTTTRPPEKFTCDPWLRLRLAGAPAEKRLLKMDL